MAANPEVIFLKSLDQWQGADSRDTGLWDASHSVPDELSEMQTLSMNPARIRLTGDHAARHASRLERATPLLDTIKRQVEASRVDSLPPSHWAKPPAILSRFGRN
jgi:hypothetical protein